MSLGNSFNETSLEKHLLASCHTHMLPLNLVCVAESCHNRLLCNECFQDHPLKHKSDIILIKTLLDESNIQLIDKKKAESKQGLDYHQNKLGVLEHVWTSLEYYEYKMTNLIDTLRTEIKKKYKEAQEFLLKYQAEIESWENFLKYFVVKRETLLMTSPASTSKELESFIAQYNSLILRIDTQQDIDEEGNISPHKKAGIEKESWKGLIHQSKKLLIDSYKKSLEGWITFDDARDISDRRTARGRQTMKISSKSYQDIESESPNFEPQKYQFSFSEFGSPSHSCVTESTKAIDSKPGTILSSETLSRIGNHRQQNNFLGFSANSNPSTESTVENYKNRHDSLPKINVLAPKNQHKKGILFI